LVFLTKRTAALVEHEVIEGTHSAEHPDYRRACSGGAASREVARSPASRSDRAGASQENTDFRSGERGPADPERLTLEQIDATVLSWMAAVVPQSEIELRITLLAVTTTANCTEVCDISNETVVTSTPSIG